MTKTTQTEKPATIDTAKLDTVTGGCAKCGNPNHKQKPQSGEAQQ